MATLTKSNIEVAMAVVTEGARLFMVSGIDSLSINGKGSKGH